PAPVRVELVGDDGRQRRVHPLPHLGAGQPDRRRAVARHRQVDAGRERLRPRHRPAPAPRPAAHHEPQAARRGPRARAGPDEKRATAHLHDAAQRAIVYHPKIRAKVQAPMSGATMSEIPVQLTKQPRPRPAETALGFGKYFSDHMFVMDWEPGKEWHEPRVVPYAPISLDPAAAVFHYGQAMFEG